jgi:hypothetical protein
MVEAAKSSALFGNSAIAPVKEEEEEQRRCWE